MPVEAFARLEYDILLKRKGFYTRVPPTFSDWMSNRAQFSTGYASRMRAGELAPAPAIDKHADGRVIGVDGIHRAMAAKQLGFTHIPVIIFTEKRHREQV